jgi:hypothetical protein
MFTDDVIFIGPREIHEVSWTPFLRKPNIKQNDTKPRKKFILQFIKFNFTFLFNSGQNKSKKIRFVNFLKYNEHFIVLSFSGREQGVISF